MKRLMVWAHRGASGCAPENTLAAFRLAESQGADGVELDVQLSRDGTPVVLHDETLERTSNGRGPVSEWLLEDLARLDAGSWFAPEFAGEPLPTLSTVLAWAGSRVWLNIEIKDAAAGGALLDLLRDFREAKVLVSSFDHRLLGDLRQAQPDLPLGFLIDSRFWRRTLARAVENRASSFHPRADQISRALVEACHAAGLKVFPWTVDQPAAARRLLALGVDGFFTNVPEKMLLEFAEGFE